jgi:uncharacterized membrane protein
MKNLFSKFEWTLWIIVLIPSLTTIWLWERIPQTIPTHYNLVGEADAWGDKSILLWVVPTMTFFLYLLLLFVPLIDPKRRLEGMGGKYFILRLILLSLISIISFVWVYTSANNSVGFTAGLFPILALFLMVLGNYLQAIKPNYFIGIRTPWTLQDERNWQLTHRVGGRVYMIGGLLLLLGSFFMGSQGFNAFFLVGLLVVLLIPFGYSFFIYATQKQ